MKGRTTLRIGTLIAAFVVLALLPPAAEAAPDRVTVGSVTATVGEQGAVDVRASDVAPNGVVDWVVNIGYDQGLAAVANLDLPECERTGTPCTGTNNSNPGTDAVIVLEGTSPGGMPAEATLATIVFRCEHAGTSDLTLEISRWDAEASTELIAPPETADGTLECIAAPTATPAPLSLPPSGAGPASGSAWQWAAAILSATGASLVAIWALRRERA